MGTFITTLMVAMVITWLLLRSSPREAPLDWGWLRFILGTLFFLVTLLAYGGHGFIMALMGVAVMDFLLQHFFAAIIALALLVFFAFHLEAFLDEARQRRYERRLLRYPHPELRVDGEAIERELHDIFAHVAVPSGGDRNKPQSNDSRKA
jgi:hypothetical protein